MKVVLCTLPSEGQYVSWIHPMLVEPAAVKYIPLGLLSLASNIVGHEIKILDSFSEGWGIDETLDRIAGENPDVVGFSSETRRVYALYELLKQVKAPWKIAGGPHATNHAGQLLKRGADAVFVGPLADQELQRWLDNPVKGRIVCNTPLVDLNFPNRRLINYEKYFYDGKVLFEAKKRMVMFTSIGCPHGCKFCSVQSRKIQRKSPEKVIKEMFDLKGLGAESLHFLDDNFNVSSRYVQDILNEMDRWCWDMEWSMRGQVKFDLDLIPRMKEHGLKRFHVGIEALDDNLLHWLGKRQTVKDIEKVCKVMARNDVDVLAYFMIGVPGETEEYLNSLPEKIKDLGIRYPYFNILFPEPDTEYGRTVQMYWDAYMENPFPNYSLPVDPPKMSLEYAERIMKEFM